MGDYWFGLAALVVLLGSIVFYIVAAQWLGFHPTAFIILMSMFLVLRVRPVRAVIVALVATVTIHLVFYKAMRVPLPWGLLTPYAW